MTNYEIDVQLSDEHVVCHTNNLLSYTSYSFGISSIFRGVCLWHHSTQKFTGVIQQLHQWIYAVFYLTARVKYGCTNLIGSATNSTYQAINIFVASVIMVDNPRCITSRRPYFLKFHVCWSIEIPIANTAADWLTRTWFLALLVLLSVSVKCQRGAISQIFWISPSSKSRKYAIALTLKNTV